MFNFHLKLLRSSDVEAIFFASPIKYFPGCLAFQDSSKMTLMCGEVNYVRGKEPFGWQTAKNCHQSVLISKLGYSWWYFWYDHLISICKLLGGFERIMFCKFNWMPVMFVYVRKLVESFLLFSYFMESYHLNSTKYFLHDLKFFDSFIRIFFYC